MRKSGTNKTKRRREGKNREEKTNRRGYGRAIGNQKHTEKDRRKRDGEKKIPSYEGRDYTSGNPPILRQKKKLPAQNLCCGTNKKGKNDEKKCH